MDNRIFSEALKATARIACAAAIVGSAQVGGAAMAQGAAGDGEARQLETRSLEVAHSATQETYLAEALAAQGMEMTSEAATGLQTPDVLCQFFYQFGVVLPGCTPWGPPMPPAHSGAQALA